jgi:AraC family transcriptional regulator
MNRFTPLCETALCAVARFDHPPGDHHDPQEEHAPKASVNFVESGTFGLRAGKERHQLGPGLLFVPWPGLVFSCEHEESPSDVCLSVRYARDFSDEIGGVSAERPQGPPVAPLTNRLAYLRLLLVRAVAAEDRVGADTVAGELLAGVRTDDAPRPLFRARQLSWYAARIDAVREKLRAEYEQPHLLKDLAREAGMSPFHFSRVFRELAGTPPHRYLREVRLARAAEMLRQGASVTRACFDCGFTNLSHFTRSFRRRFGVPPSRLAA